MADAKITDLVDAGAATALDYLYIVDGATSKHIQFDDFEGSLTHDNLVAGTIASHDTTATGAQCTTLTDGSDADALHAHAVNDAKVSYTDAVAVGLNTAKNTNVSTTLSVGTNNTTTLAITSDGGADDVTIPIVTTAVAGAMNSAMFDQLALAVTHYGDNTQAHSDYLLNSAADVGVGLSLTGDNSSADTTYVPNVLYNTDATPPAANTVPIGTIYVQYTA